jgi:phosphofructokinase-like protein
VLVRAKLIKRETALMFVIGLRVGVLSGGGDAPGINAVIRAVVQKGIGEYGYEMVGIRDGWRGLIEGDMRTLNLEEVSEILRRGGSILGTSRANPFKKEGDVERIFANVVEWGIDVVIAIGGEDTLGVAAKLSERGLKCVGVPKTIDNDLACTDCTFGFNTAVSIATEALDRLLTTAETHHRVMVLEVMGRDTGHIALEAGLAGGADMILIPELPFNMTKVCEQIRRRQDQGKKFSLIVVAEGAKPEGTSEVVYSNTVDDFGHVRLGGVGYLIGKEIEQKLGIETRVVILGHLQRGGTPTAYDRILATRYGVAAINLVHKKRFGRVVCLKHNRITNAPLSAVLDKRKTADMDLYRVASTFFG